MAETPWRPRALREQALLHEFAQWVATNRAYNGSPHDWGQNLYNESLNGVLPTWADEFLAEKEAAVDRRPHSRACGIRNHDHGSECHSNCPTCGGKDERVSP